MAGGGDRGGRGAPDPDKLLARVHLGTAGWSYKDWVGPFYPDGTPAAGMLERYMERYRAVELDSSFYGIPPKRNVEAWRRKARPGFAFAPKFPQVITHEKFLVDCDEELEVFLGRMALLGDALGPLVLQFPYFNKKSGVEVMGFVGRLKPFLERFEALGGRGLCVEVRNKTFWKPPLLDLLRAHGVPLVVIDHPWMPPPDQLLGRDDLLTGGLAYVRLLGDRYGIEKITKTWERPVLDLGWRLDGWARWIREVLPTREVWAFANNHFAGFAPASIDDLRDRIVSGR
ncbi:MAG: DUF72 domain-containing protein [Planctomycetota bacterium]